MPNYRFIPYNDIQAMRRALDDQVAAVILEPIQGEGGVRIPDECYLEEVGKLCRVNGSLLIVDEIQTGFCRTGPMFAIDSLNIKPDFLTMAKGIAGGFPLGAFAISEAVSAGLEAGDHGGTYCGNPLGCAVSYAVIRYLLDHNISAHVTELGNHILSRMYDWLQRFPEIIKGFRGRGLLLAIEFCDENTAGRVTDECINKGLFVRQTQGNLIRIFPALNIRFEELEEGLAIVEAAIGSMV
jgi:acetylornithine/N-succinyldiaminopimelate aminotransferase